jgi:cell division protein FtsB
MKVFQSIVSLFANRYLLAVTAFTVWIIFFDENNMFVQRQRTKDLTELKTKIAYYRNQVDLTRKELKDLQNDPATLEKYAREKYFMKRDNEEVFVIDSATANSIP